MARYIDADKLVERLKASPIFQDFNTDGYFIRDMVIDLVECQQTADVVPKSEVAREVIDEFKVLTKEYLLSRSLYLVSFKNAIAYAENELKNKYIGATNDES